jgi:hypothetical protein
MADLVRRRVRRTARKCMTFRRGSIASASPARRVSTSNSHASRHDAGGRRLTGARRSDAGRSG